jgi:hypothetical protein
MNRMQRALTPFFFAASLMVSGVAPARVSDSSGGPYYRLELPAVEADPASAVRGSLGVSFENLSLSNDLGKLVFFLNGGFALLAGAFACFAVARHHREPIRDHDHVGDWRSEGLAAVTSVESPPAVGRLGTVESGDQSRSGRTVGDADLGASISRVV